MSLQIEIEDRRRLIKTESYSMSIGELMNIYQSNELDLHPDFQRFYRWTSNQKARLIESILLGIPLPPVFVSQRQDGVWDVIDGLQRLSAIFQFAGILRRENGEFVERLRLTGTKYLPSLDNAGWEKLESYETDDHAFLTTQQRIDIKRAKIDVNIILRESDRNAQYDMFERLNTGGTQLSEQEVRNCLLLMANKAFYVHLEQMSNHPDFLNTIALTDRQKEERYDMELVVRYLVLQTLPEQPQLRKVDVGTLLTDKLLELASGNYDVVDAQQRFGTTFKILNAVLSDSSFRRYDVIKQRFAGAALVSTFEVLAIGLGQFVDKWSADTGDAEQISNMAKQIWTTPAFINHQGSGVSGADRIPHTIPLGRQLFKR